MKRSYRQYCSLARAMDLLGERWTLLILRELLPGPRRYSDIERNLPAIGTNLLAARLKDLTKTGLVEKVPLWKDGPEGYALTDTGRALEPALVALAAWGVRLLGEARDDDYWSEWWNPLALKARFRSERARGVHAVYEYAVGESVFHAEVKDGSIVTHPGQALHPDVRLSAEPGGFFRFVSGEVTLEEALETHLVRLEGKPNAIATSLALFSA